MEEKLNKLRPYVTGLRFVKDLPVIDLVLRESWDIFESDTVTYKHSTNNTNYFMVFPKNPKDGIDMVLEHVGHIISVNIEKEKKLTLLKAKIEELKVLFTNTSLDKLERLKFIIENITDPTLKDITFPTPPISPHRRIKNNIELPPKKEQVLEKEEN
jgi:hypothetical protein